MANTFNGIGTTFYGKRDFHEDGSYITTKWFVLAFLPIFPVASRRVRYLESSGVPFLSRESSFEVVEELPMHGVQVISTYAYAIFIVAWCGGLMTSNMAMPAKLVLLALGIALPHALRYFGKVMAS